MTTLVRYEVTVAVRCAMSDEAAEQFVREALASGACGFHPSRVFVTDAEDGRPEVFAGGEEDDWWRDDEERHRVVRDAVIERIPSARVSTSWLGMDEPPWDSVFEDEDSDAETAEVAS